MRSTYVEMSDIRVGAELKSKPIYDTFKRFFDIGCALALMPVLCWVALILLFLNHFLNKGNLFFFQKRMGWSFAPFVMIKFRTMQPIKHPGRHPVTELEKERISRLAHILRKFRLDELPQIINVLLGDMSMIGPRPDYVRHARYFAQHVDNYRKRYDVKPGISGLAQVRQGYTIGIDETRKKVRYDLFYIEKRSALLDARIALFTILTVMRGFGAK